MYLNIKKIENKKLLIIEKKMNSCFVCCETFNKSNRKQIICPNSSCEFLVCKSCVRQYLLSQKNHIV